MFSRLILPTALGVIGGLILLAGCATEPDVVSARPGSTYGSYYPYYSGSSYAPPGGQAATYGTSSAAASTYASGSGSSSRQGEVISVRKYYPPGVYPIQPAGMTSAQAMTALPAGVLPASAAAFSTPPPTRVATPPPAPTRTVSTQRKPRMNPSSLLHQVKVKTDYIPRSARGRRDARSMRPRYITIHSTQNWSRGADAWRHGLALKRSKLGRLSWHYTTDENVAVQHLPTTITGNHADYDGPGNRYSIGIEMCEHPGNSRSATVERTAKLAAYLMNKYDIPLTRVVPHYHWPRKGQRPPNKNCPHFLLSNGRPGSKWRGFLSQVNNYHQAITLPQSDSWAKR